MSDDPRKNNGSPTAAGQRRPASLDPAPTRDPRVGLVAQVRYRYDRFIDFVATQSVNISRSGMFVASSDEHRPGAVLEFEFTLADGYVLLRGRGEVVRTSDVPRGVGVRFLDLDPQSRKLIDRIVEVNAREGKRPTVPADLADPASVVARPSLAGSAPAARLPSAVPQPPFAPARTPVSGGVTVSGRDVRLQLSPATVGYFISNPLLNVRLGGFVVPADEDVALGTVFAVTLTTLGGEVLVSGKGKVVTKHENRLGIRLADVDKAVLARLQAEVAKLAAPSKS